MQYTKYGTVMLYWLYWHLNHEKQFHCAVTPWWQFTHQNRQFTCVSTKKNAIFQVTNPNALQSYCEGTGSWKNVASSAFALPLFCFLFRVPNLNFVFRVPKLNLYQSCPQLMSCRSMSHRKLLTEFWCPKWHSENYIFSTCSHY